MSPNDSRILGGLKKKKSSKKRLRNKPVLRLEVLEPRTLFSANPLTPGDIVLAQVGTSGAGSQTSGNATQIYLDEYTPSGTLVQQIPLSISNTGGNIALTTSGTAGGAAQISLSPNGQELAIFGYNDSNLSANTAGQTQSVGIVGANGTILYEASATNITTNANAVAISSANAVYIGGNTGLYYAGTFASGGTSMAGANIGLGSATSIQIDNGELFGSSSKSGGIWNFGSSLPTSATTPTELTTGAGTFVDGSNAAVTVGNDLGGTASYTPGAPVGFFFANLGSANSTYDGMYDTLYVADDATACGAILKYSYNSSTGNWTFNGGIEGLTNNDSIIGVTGTVNGGNVTLAITAGGGEASGTKNDGGYVYTVTDNTGFGGNPSSLTLANAVTNSNSANIEFRGIAQAPDDGNGTLGGFGGSAAYTQGASAISIDSAATFADGSNYDGGSLTISGAGAFDTLAIAAGGSITLSGNAVSYNGTVIGTYPTSGAGSGANGANLTVTFNAIGNEASPNATTGTGEVVTGAAVQALLDAITFNSTGSSATGDRTIAFKVSENNGNATSASQTVHVAAPASGNLPAINQSANVGVNESSSPGLVTVNLSGITANGATGQTLSVMANSNNQSIVADGSITVNYDSANGPSTGSITFTPVANAAGNATITVTVTDSNGSTEDTFELTSVAPPAVTAPANQSASQNTNHAIAFGNNAVSDSFIASGDSMSLSLADVDGNLTLQSVAGGATIGSNGTSNVTLTGTPAQIDTTLAAGAMYNAGATFTGNDTLTITANDTGNTASGVAQTVSAALNIDVQAPTITVNTGLDTPIGAKTFIYGTNGGTVTSNTMLVTTDPDYPTANITYTLTATPTEGTLYSNATGNAVALTVGSTFTQNNINGSGSDLYYVGNANAVAGSTDSFSFTVSDGVNTTADTAFSIKVDTPSTVSYGTPNANYTQNFSALPGTAGNGPAFTQDGPFDFVGNAASTPPQGIGSSAALNGWSMDQTGNTGNTATEKFFTDFGNAQTTGGVYSVGANGSTTRALGMLGTSANASDIGVTLVNTTGEEINQISIAYLGEQWLSNANLNTLTFDYSLGGTSIAGSGFTADSALNYAGTLTSANATENANGAPLASANVAGTISGLDWAPNETLVLRWQIDGTGSASGLAIANFSFSGDAAPVLAANAGITTSVDSTANIGSNILQVTDTDNTEAQLTYTLSSVPSAALGTLDLNGSPLAVNSTFTQADVDHGNLAFVAGGSTGTGSFAFTASDPSGAAVSGNVSIGVGQAPLELNHDTGATLLQGGTSTIGNVSLQLTEAGVSDDSNLVFTLANAPLHGTLTDNGNEVLPGGTFTQADIDAGLLTYTHNDSEIFSDGFSFTASDGQGGSLSTSTFEITVTPVPTVTTNTGFNTPSGAATFVQGTVGGNVTSATMLITSDGSEATSGIIYTLTAIPTDGNLFITGNTTALSVGSTFTQSNLNGTSKLYYVNSGGAGGTNDSFSFTVSDGTHTSGNTTVNITLDTPTTVGYGTANSTYTQNFDALPGTSGNGPTFVQNGPFDFVGNASAGAPQGLSSNANLAGWSMAQYGNTSANATEKFVADFGNAQTTGAVYSFGANGASDRALGLVGTSSNASEVGITLVNNTGETLNQISIDYLGEQWTSNTNLNTLAFDYALGDSSITGANFIADAALSYAGTVTSANATENANGTPLASANVAGTIAGLDWAAGETLVLKWQVAGTGSASGLAIDDFSFSAATTPPTFTDGGSYAGTVNSQTAANGAAVATVTATPTAGDTISGYAITAGNANGAFAVAANGAITVANAAAITGTSYVLTVEATDSTNDTTATATVDVAVQSPPVFSGAPYSGTVNTQTAANGTAVVAVAATGENGDTLSYAIIGGDSASAFSIGANGAITVANAAALAGTSYTLAVEATDTVNDDTANATVDVTIQSPPVFSGAPYSGTVNTQTAANGTAVVTVSATGENGDTPSYAITGGNANGAFAVAANGAITVANAAALAGTSYALSVEATDTVNENTANATVNVTVQSPPIFSQANYTLGAISGSAANGTSVGNVTATAEGADTLSYALSGAGSSFFVVSNTGNITVANSPITSGNYTLTLTATDNQNGDTATANVSISTSEIHIGTQPTFTVNKLATAGAMVGTFAANDTATLTYSLANTGAEAANDALFAINANTGAITVANAAGVAASIAGHATSANLTVEVLLTDSTGGSANDAITVVDSTTGTMAPSLANPADANQTITLAENSKAGGNVANVASDVTAAYTGQKFTYSIASGHDATNFKISSSGLITAVNELTYASGSSYSIAVDVADSKSPTAVSVMDLTINVTDQASTITGANGALTVADNKAIDPFSKMKVTDVVATQSLSTTITLSNAADGNLSLANGSSVSFTAETGVNAGTYTLTGNAAAVTAALDKIVFTPTQNLVAVNSSTDTTFTVEVNDGLGTANSTATNGSTAVSSLSINDAPTITIPTTTNPAGKVVPVSTGQTASDETAIVNSVSYTGTISPFTQVTIKDPDVGQSLTVAVTIPTANGTLAGGGFDGGVIDGKNITYTFTAAYSAGMTAAQVSAAANAALHALVFTPTAHQVAPGKTVTTTFAITVSDGAVKTPTSNKSATVIATAVSDLPGVVVGTANMATGDNATIKPLAAGNVAISDPDFGIKDTLTITVANTNLGTLSGGGIKETTTTSGIYTVAGNMAQLAADLANITFTPKQNLVVPGTVTDEAINFTVTQDTAAGTLTTSVANITLAINSINNAPTITGTSTTAIKVNDNGANSTVNPFTSKVTIGDVDPGQTETATITLSNAANGNLSLTGGTADVTFTSQGNGVYTLSGGNAADTTTALHELVFTPTAHQVDLKANVTTTFNIAVTDSGNITTGSSTLSAISDSKTMVVATAVDSAPTALGATLTNPALTGPVAVGTSVLTLNTTDADLGDKFAYSLVSVTGTTNENSQFKIGTGALANQLVVGNSKGLAVGTYTVSLEVKDSGGKSVIRTFTITIGASSSSVS